MSGIVEPKAREDMAPRTGREARLLREGYVDRAREGAKNLEAIGDAILRAEQRYPEPTVERPRSVTIGDSEYRVVGGCLLEYRPPTPGTSTIFERTVEWTTAIRDLLNHPTERVPVEDADA